MGFFIWQTVFVQVSLAQLKLREPSVDKFLRRIDTLWGLDKGILLGLLGVLDAEGARDGEGLHRDSLV